MHISHQILELQTAPGIDIQNLTGQLQAALAASGVHNGLMVITSRHTTTALGVNEYEPRLLEDLRTLFQRLAPPDAPYQHNDIHLRDCPPDEPENAHSHLLAMLLSSSETVSVVDGSLALGVWQSVLFFELDGPRRRQINLQIIGE